MIYELTIWNDDTPYSLNKCSLFFGKHIRGRFDLIIILKILDSECGIGWKWITVMFTKKNKAGSPPCYLSFLGIFRLNTPNKEEEIQREVVKTLTPAACHKKNTKGNLGINILFCCQAETHLCSCQTDSWEHSSACWPSQQHSQDPSQCQHLFISLRETLPLFWNPVVQYCANKMEWIDMG